MSKTGTAEELAAMRVSYEQEALDEADLAASWHEQLLRWLGEAVQSRLAEPNAMVLATTNADGRSSTRSMLCKVVDARGLVFFTNYSSAKSHDLLAAGWASVTFPWYAMQRQVHVRGPAEKISPAETAAYWSTRPRGSQLGAWASSQSTVVTSRAVLDAAFAGVRRRFAGAEHIPVPPHWGGWRIRPQTVEFWQGRPDRMHDRLVYEHTDDQWRIKRLSP
jgi:pyridoxamine 5'-phosphate oxidase